MIIPIKCFTCGNVLADKYLYYKQEIGKKKKGNDVIYFSESKMKKTPEAGVLDKLQLIKLCCRRHMLTHVDIE